MRHDTWVPSATLIARARSWCGARSVLAPYGRGARRSESSSAWNGRRRATETVLQCAIKWCAETKNDRHSLERFRRGSVRRFSSSDAQAIAQIVQRPERVRNIGVIAHIDAGKTTTTERMLFYSGTTRVYGDVDSGDTVTDFLPQERERGITIQSAAVSVVWREHVINIIDTPGHVDFTLEVERALMVMDGCVAVIDGVAGVQAQTETVWRQATSYDLPVIAFVNKLDREGADLRFAASTLKSRLGANSILIQVPLFTASSGARGADSGSIRGFVDLVRLTICLYDDSDEQGATLTVSKFSSQSDLVGSSLLSRTEAESVQRARAELVEQVADIDDKVMDFYLDGDDSQMDLELPAALRRLSLERRAVPVLCGSALKNRGVQPVMDAVLDYLPNPLERKPPRIGGSESSVISESRGNEHQKQGHEQRQSTKEEGAKPRFLNLQPDAALVALAFKVVHDTHRGALVFIRIFAGSLSGRNVRLYNASRDVVETPQKLLRLMADDVEELVHGAAFGSVFAASGLKHTMSGDTLTSTAVRSEASKSMLLQGLRIPPAVFSAAVRCDSSGANEELQIALERLVREDPSLRVADDEETGELVIHGMGELHLEVIRDRLVSEYGLPVRMGVPRVAYKETVMEHVQDFVQFDKEIGGRRLVAQMEVSIAPAPRGQGLSVDLSALEEILKRHEDGTEATKKRNGEAQKQHPVLVALDSALRAALMRGAVAGYPVEDVVVRVLGSNAEELLAYEPAAVSSCAAFAIRSLLPRASPTALEPLMRLQISVPNDFLGAVMSDLTAKRRGIIEHVEALGESGGRALIHSHVPLAGLVGYASALRSASRGSASFTMQFDSYSETSELLK
ncbi:Elongation factor G [Porphyridium purpureum]|uniref:Elongation factor G n=1 Tax=Porphyridium purpureum TaxID=35688 RepID=A0A5J4Z611_PORPP|nr:Elongation factor G [Porphyridium purpureum]|eukprot:POR9503..scf295_1